MSYAEQKRRNDKAMKERMEKMAEQQRKQELETQRRQKLREARERKLAKEKAEKDAIEAERMRKAEEDAKQVKLQPGLLRQGSGGRLLEADVGRVCNNKLLVYDHRLLQLVVEDDDAAALQLQGQVPDRAGSVLQ